MEDAEMMQRYSHEDKAVVMQRSGDEDKAEGCSETIMRTGP